MLKDYQYNSTQAGHDTLKACDTFRKILKANINPAIPLEEKVEMKSKIKAMDYNELRSAVIVVTLHMKDLADHLSIIDADR